MIFRIFVTKTGGVVIRHGPRRDFDPLPLLASPLRDPRLVSVTLFDVTLVAQSLKVPAVKEVILADRPWVDVIHTLRSLEDSFALALLAKRMIFDKRFSQLMPTRCVIGRSGSLTDVSPSVPSSGCLRVPSQRLAALMC